MTVQDAVLIAAVLLLGVGVLRDISRSEDEKGAGNGPLNGTFRPFAWTGFSRGLPWYLAGVLLLVVVAWGNW